VQVTLVNHVQVTRVLPVESEELKARVIHVLLTRVNFLVFTLVWNHQFIWSVKIKYTEIKNKSFIRHGLNRYNIVLCHISSFKAIYVETDDDNE